MGGKLGKKARKFAKNHLKSVLHQRRKTKTFSAKRKPYSKNEKNNEEVQDGSTVEHSSGRDTDFGDVSNTSLDAVFQTNDADEFGDLSDSDGYLSEDSSCQHIVGTTDVLEVAGGGTGTLSEQNKAICKELTIQKKKLDQLQKDPDFCEFLQSYKDSENTQKDDNMLSDEDEDEIENDAAEDKVKFLTSTAITSWCQLVKEENSVPALTCLLNAYRAACHYGAESSGHHIQGSDAFSNILLTVLSEADNTFKSQLQISLTNWKKETVNQLKNNSKWKILKPLVKSYFRSTLFLLNQVVDSDILVFALSRLKASLNFFTLFPSLLHRLIKTTVILWATGGEVLSSAAFLILKDVGAVGNDYLDACIARTFTAYIAQSRVSEISNMSRMEFMSNGIIELCSLDVPKSSKSVQASISQLLKILQWAMQTKKKEPLKMVCSWEYVNCIDLWVKFIKVNIQEYDLQPLLLRTIQLINGVACMFNGIRYLPLRMKCIQWLNNLSTASGVFVPVASLALDSLEYKITKEGCNAETAIDFSAILKLPRSCLRSQAFQEFCLTSAIEQLSAHFAQWSYHISFPDLATVPLISLRKFHESTTNEGFRRMVKRLIDQVEHNVEFVQKRRDEAAFSPSDHQSVEMFLQLEKSGKDTPFVQYYRSIMEKAGLRTSLKEGKLSMPKKMQKKSKRKHSLTEEGPANGSLPNAVVNKQKRARAQV